MCAQTGKDQIPQLLQPTEQSGIIVFIFVLNFRSSRQTQ